MRPVQICGKEKKNWPKPANKGFWYLANDRRENLGYLEYVHSCVTIGLLDTGAASAFPIAFWVEQLRFGAIVRARPVDAEAPIKMTCQEIIKIIARRSIAEARLDAKVQSGTCMSSCAPDNHGGLTSLQRYSSSQRKANHEGENLLSTGDICTKESCKEKRQKLWI